LTNERGFNPWQAQEIFLFSIMSRLALSGAVSLDSSGRGMELTTQLPLLMRLKMVNLYLHSPYVLMVWCLIS
jgi:hypothetical protein